MRRLGTLVMIVGANIVAASIAVAFWRAALQCAIEARGGACPQGGAALFVEMMTSSAGLIYWVVIAVGLLVFWRGKRIRAQGYRDQR